MNRYTFMDDNGTMYERINKKKAERLYNSGASVVFCPVNLRPFNRYCPLSMEINKENINCNYQPFKTIVDCFEFYNCSCNETGYYTAFYIPVKEA